MFLHIMIRNGIKSVDGFFSSCLVSLHEVRRNVPEVGCPTADLVDSCWSVTNSSPTAEI